MRQRPYDQRKDPRIPTLIQVDYRTADRFFSDFAEDISAGGLFIATPQPLPIGTPLTLELFLPESPKPLRLKGVVAWTRPAARLPSERRGMGIKFEGLSKEEREHINKIVRKLRAVP